MQDQEKHVAGWPVNTTAKTLRTVEAYVRRKARMPYAPPRDDIAQEAALAVLEHEPTELDTWQTCQRYVGRAVCRWRAPVSLPADGSHADEFGVGSIVAVVTDSATDVTTPEARVAAAQILARWHRIKAELDAAESEAARALPPVVRKIGAAAADGRYYGMHADLGRKHGMTPKQVVYALGRYGRALDRAPSVVALRMAMRDLRREARQ